MHVLGLRLGTSEIDTLFKESDLDNSGEIDLDEFTKMVKKYLNIGDTGGVYKPSDPHASYRDKWSTDELKLETAAGTLQV